VIAVVPLNIVLQDICGDPVGPSFTRTEDGTLATSVEIEPDNLQGNHTIGSEVEMLVTVPARKQGEACGKKGKQTL
jgi:hypothetical protein